MKGLSQWTEKDYEQLVRHIQKSTRMGEELWLPAAYLADVHDVPIRRFRSLLVEGRILGRKLKNGSWEVRYPLHVKAGDSEEWTLVPTPKDEEMKHEETE